MTASNQQSLLKTSIDCCRSVETARDYGRREDTARDKGRIMDTASVRKLPAETARDQHRVLTAIDQQILLEIIVD